MLHCSFSLPAAQLLVKMTSALQKSQCCSATSAAQHSENCSATSVFACGMLQGWGLEGWGLGLADKHITFFNINFLPSTQNPPFWSPRKIIMCLISWERTQKRDPHKLFRGHVGGQKWGPKRAIFGHGKFSLLFFSLPLDTPRFSAPIALKMACFARFAANTLFRAENAARCPKKPFVTNVANEAGSIDTRFHCAKQFAQKRFAQDPLRAQRLKNSRSPPRIEIYKRE